MNSRLLPCLILLMLAFACPAAEPPKRIARAAVTSSNLAGVGYHAPSKTLEIEFKNGGIYRYYEVPPATHSALMDATSKGGYFQKNIRGKFRFTREDPRRTTAK